MSRPTQVSVGSIGNPMSELGATYANYLDRKDKREQLALQRKQLELENKRAEEQLQWKREDRAKAEEQDALSRDLILNTSRNLPAHALAANVSDRNKINAGAVDAFNRTLAQSPELQAREQAIQEDELNVRHGLLSAEDANLDARREQLRQDVWATGDLGSEVIETYTGYTPLRGEVQASTLKQGVEMGLDPATLLELEPKISGRFQSEADVKKAYADSVKDANKDRQWRTTFEQKDRIARDKLTAAANKARSGSKNSFTGGSITDAMETVKGLDTGWFDTRSAMDFLKFGVTEKGISPKAMAEAMARYMETDAVFGNKKVPVEDKKAQILALAKDLEAGGTNNIANYVSTNTPKMLNPNINPKANRLERALERLNRIAKAPEGEVSTASETKENGKKEAPKRTRKEETITDGLSEAEFTRLDAALNKERLKLQNRGLTEKPAVQEVDPKTSSSRYSRNRALRNTNPTPNLLVEKGIKQGADNRAAFDRLVDYGLEQGADNRSYLKGLVASRWNDPKEVAAREKVGAAFSQAGQSISDTLDDMGLSRKEGGFFEPKESRYALTEKAPAVPEVPKRPVAEAPKAPSYDPTVQGLQEYVGRNVGLGRELAARALNSGNREFQDKVMQALAPNHPDLVKEYFKNFYNTSVSEVGASLEDQAIAIAERLGIPKGEAYLMVMENLRKSYP